MNPMASPVLVSEYRIREVQRITAVVPRSVECPERYHSRPITTAVIL